MDVGRGTSAGCVVRDDVHLLDGSPSMDLLADLCERLPANAHLVLGTRTPSALPIRLRRHEDRPSSSTRQTRVH